MGSAGAWGRARYGYRSWRHRPTHQEESSWHGETGFDDVTHDLVSVQYHSLKAGHDYGQYVRGAKYAGRDDIASFFEEVMSQDSQRASRCHEFMKDLSGNSRSGPAVT